MDSVTMRRIYSESPEVTTKFNYVSYYSGQLDVKWGIFLPQEEELSLSNKLLISTHC